MNHHFTVPVLAILLSGATAVLGQERLSGPHAAAMEQLDERFRQMDQMMDEAQKAGGAQRGEIIQKHMRMMQEQMAEAHSMMTRMRGAGHFVPGPGSQMEDMQERLDFMQRLMEQMLKQQDLTLKSSGR